MANTAVTDGLTSEWPLPDLPTQPRRQLASDSRRVVRDQALLEAGLTRQLREVAPVWPAAAILAAFQVLLFRLRAQVGFAVTVRIGGHAASGASSTPAVSNGSFPVVCHTTPALRFGELIGAASSAIATMHATLAPSATTPADSIDVPVCFDSGEWRLWARPTPAQFFIECEYDADAFDLGAGRRLLNVLEDVIRAGISQPEGEISGFPWPDPDVCVHTLVERHARRAPGDVAVVFGDQVVEYAALDHHASAICGALRACAVAPGGVVALYLSRSVDLVTALLGVMKTGAVWVALDPADPQARVTAILEHSGAVAVVTDTARSRQLPPSSLPLVCVDDLSYLAGTDCGAAAATALDAPVCHIYACEARELKSTCLSHGALSLLLSSVRRELSLTHEDVGLALSPPSLEASLLELLAPLSGTGCVVIADDDVALDADRLTEAIRRFAPTFMIAPTTIWSDLLNAAATTWPRLKAICFGAVPARTVSVELCARTSAAWFAGASLPAAIWTTLHRLTERDSAGLLGRPLRHVYMRILDEDGTDAPVDVAGELLVRVADGAASWSRTGQRARWRNDILELVAARPREAYVDGFRIDLDDLADVLRQQPTIVDAEVELDVSTSPQRLVACVVPAVGARCNVSELRRELRRTVPPAMVPKSFVEVSSICHPPQSQRFSSSPVRK